MANDDETLTFRLRAIAENMSAFGKAARGADDVNAAMIKSQKVAEQLANSNRKLTAARDKESDAAGRVRVAEQKLNEVMGNSKSKISQIAAAEERLATARRNSARASSDASKIEADFKKTATEALAKIAQDGGETAGHLFSIGFRKSSNDGSIESDATRKSSTLGRIFGGGGEDAGHRFSIGFGRKTNNGSIESETGKVASFLSRMIFGPAGEDSGHRFSIGFGKGKGDLGKAVEHDLAAVAGDAEKGASLVGRTFGTGILSGLEGLLKSEAGPYVAAGLTAAAAVVAPAIGAVLAGGVVLAFGAGLTALAVVFALKSDVVKSKWKATIAAMSADLKGIARPFDAVMVHLADSARATLGRFAPVLQSIFATSAGPVQRFVDDVLGALEKLKPALVPISDAFNALLTSLGPALQDTLSSIADGLIAISKSVSNNPNGLPDFIRGIGNLVQELLGIIGILNDANGAFEHMTGGISAVTVFMDILQVAVGLVLGPFIILAKYITIVSNTYNALAHGTDVAGKSMSDAANHTVLLFRAMKQTGGAAVGLKKPLQDTHDLAVANQKAAAAAATAFDQWVSSMFKLQNEAISVAQAQLAVKQAFADAAASITSGSAKVVLARNKDLAAMGRVKVAEAQLAQLRQNGKATNAQITAAEVRLSDARRNAKVASDNLTKATAANTKGLDLNSQKGRDEYGALLRVAAAIQDATEKQLRHKVALGQVTASAIVSRDNFIKLAEEMGFNSKQAQKMARDMISIPNVKRTATMDANTAALQRKVAAAQAQIDHMHGKIVPITYTFNGTNFTLGTGPQATARGKGAVATGGKISGPGSGTSDRAGVFALSNNEFVVKAKSAQQYGDKAMYSVNNGTATIIPGMAAGGAVDIHGTGVFKNAAQLRAVLGRSIPASGGAASGASSAAGAGAGVQRWRGVALAALAAAHEPASWIGSLLRRMNQESGGNPRAINNWDSNARAGDPSRGLMQTIGSTFNAYAGPYRSRGIYDPFANIFAAIKYTVARYGSGPTGWDRAGGYKNGGWLMPGQLAYNETRQPEAVFNRQQLGALGNGKLVLEFHGDGSPYMAFLVGEFKKYVRVHGGDVQKVIGSRG